MATTPKIRYEIEAAAVGAADVRQLTGELQKLDDAISPQTAAEAARLVDQLNALGRQQAAIERFQELKTSTTAAAAALDQAQAAAQQMARELGASGPPTRSQVGQLEKLRDAVRAAKTELQAQTSGLDQARAGLTRLGIPLDGLAAKQAELRNAMRGTRDELQQLNTSAGGINTFTQLAAATEDARLAVLRAETELASFQARMESVDQPTAAQALALRRLSAELEDARSAFGNASSAQQAAASAFRAAGGSVENLTEAIAASRRAAIDSAEAARADAQAALARSRSAVQAARDRADAEQAAAQAAVAAANAADKVYERLAASTEEARVAFTRADAELEKFRSTLSAGVAATRAQQLQLEALTAAARQSQSAFASASQAQASAASAARAAGVDVDAITQAQQRARAATLATAEAARDAAIAAQAQGRAAVTAGQQQAAAAATARDGLSQLAGQLQTIQQLAGAALGGQLLGGTLGDLSRTADAYANLAARVRLVTGEGDAFRESFEGIFEVSQRTATSLENTGMLFSNIARAGKDMGVSQREALSLTETINQAVQVSGASAASSDAALQQLLQALQSGVLRGEEFNSVMEQAPRLALALADGLGVTTGELRKQAEAGALSSQVVIKALQGQAEVIANEFGQLPPTVGRALTNLSTAWTQYVGEVDKANGISATAAGAIEALAGNLDTLGTLLFSAGKAAAAYAAINLAKSFLSNAAAAGQSAAATAAETAAKTANTAALAGNTTATATNTAAKTANAAAAASAGAAAAGAAAQAGRLAGILGTLRSLTLIGLVTNLGEIGTWLGESVARWQGYGKAQEEAERTTRALEQAQREMAAADAAAAAARQRATDATMGLTAAAKELVGQYDAVIKGGGTSTEALNKLASAARLSDISGIRTMSAALDSLTVAGELAGKRVAGISTQITAALSEGGAGMEQRIQGALSQLERIGPTGVAAADSLRASLSSALATGDLERFGQVAQNTLSGLTLRAAITGEQVRESLAAALKGEDLLRFEVNARAAFDGSEQGARRLSAALQAIDVEALRRAGTSADELRSGINTAAVSAINDVDALSGALGRLGLRTAETSQAMASSLGKALDTATTERAVQAVIDRWADLGKQGLVTGDQLAAGLDQARSKLDALRPGINSLDEALKTFGLQSQSQLQATADNFRAAWAQISQSTEVGIADKIRAFERYRDAAAAANGGVVSGELRIQEEMLKSAAAARGVATDLQGVSAAAATAGQTGQQAGEQIAGAFNEARASARAAAAEIDSLSTAQRNAAVSAQSAASDQARKQLNSSSVDAGGIFAVRDKLSAGTLSEQDRQLVEAVLAAEKQNSILNSATNPSAISFEGRRDAEARMATAVRALEQLNSQRSAEANRQAAEAAKKEAERVAATANKTPEKAAESGQKGTTISGTSTTRTVNVNLTLGGRSVTIPTTESGAESLLAVLEQAKASLGG